MKYKLMSYLELTAPAFINIKRLTLFYLRTETGKKTSSFQYAYLVWRLDSKDYNYTVR